ncbi:hypothetical protein PR202_gn00070 [Eleusine coracana subsp. coracana]|uniref:Uncharacterized protein n=1 Tax=Eleusine coracana subsp. coracana TaxID=191504 RepID=A0AAV5G0K2_ELECO|nr:hypothetical protein PR202_gn00070 [Eleusine coracana subsp. coracana]
MAATISRAVAAAAPPRTFSLSPISSSRRFVRHSSFLGNSGRRASSSDSWTQDKAARTSLAPPPPIQRSTCVKDIGRASLSDNWVADKRLSVDIAPAPTASRGAYVPPPLRKLLLVNASASSAAAARADASPLTPVDISSASRAPMPVAVVHDVPDPPTTVSKSITLVTSASTAAAGNDDVSPPTTVDKLPAAHTLPSSAARTDLSIEISSSAGVHDDLAVETAACADLTVETPSPPAACTDFLVSPDACTACCADLAVEKSSPDANKLHTAVASSSRGAGSGGCSNQTDVLSSPCSYYAGPTFHKSPEPWMLPAPPTVMNRLFPINALASPGADLLLEEALATPAPVVFPPLTKIESGGCNKPSCIDYYACPAFLKAPLPGSLPIPTALLVKVLHT